jgi:hypothetical protein
MAVKSSASFPLLDTLTRTQELQMPVTLHTCARRIPSLRALWLAPLLVGLASAGAQGIHRNVGPDGRITFTDKPPAGATASPQQGIATNKPATGGAAGPVDAKPRIDPALEQSVLMLMGHEKMVAELKALCPKASPATAPVYHEAAQKWTQRHSVLLSRYPAVLRDLYPAAEQARIRNGIQQKSRTVMTNIYAAPVATRIEWCNANANEMDIGKMDMAGKASARPLLDYTPRR